MRDWKTGACSLLWAFVVASVPAQAAGKTLGDYLESADRQNVDRRLSFEQSERAAAEFHAAWLSLLPSLSVGASWTHNQFEAIANFPNPQTGELSRLVIIPKNQLDAAFRFELPLLDTTRWMKTGAAASSSASAEERERMMRDVVKRQVVGSWYGYAAALAVKKSAQKSVAVAEAQAKLLDIRFAAGAATELEQMRARAELARNQQVVADVDALVATTRRTLQTVSSLEPPDEVSLPKDDLHPEKPVTEFEGRLEGLAAVKAASHDADAAGKMAVAANLALLPIVTGQFTQRYTNATGFQNQEAIYAGGVGLVWRLDPAFVSNMSAVYAGAAAARLGAEKARQQSRDQIHQDWNRLEAARQKAQLVQAQVTAAARASQVAKDRYAVGAATQLEVIYAERDVFGAEVAQIQAMTELATARAALLLSAGLPLNEE